MNFMEYLRADPSIDVDLHPERGVDLPRCVDLAGRTDRPLDADIEHERCPKTPDSQAPVETSIPS